MSNVEKLLTREEGGALMSKKVYVRPILHRHGLLRLLTKGSF